jgi:hypothetical protein
MRQIERRKAIPFEKVNYGHAEIEITTPEAALRFIIAIAVQVRCAVYTLSGLC